MSKKLTGIHLLNDIAGETDVEKNTNNLKQDSTENSTCENNQNIRQENIEIPQELIEEEENLEEKYKSIKKEEPKDSPENAAKGSVEISTCEKEPPVSGTPKSNKIKKLNKKELRVVLVKEIPEEDSEKPQVEKTTTSVPADSIEKTEILNNYEIKNPSLTNIQTGEVIEIDKPIFKIGKDPAYADYTINEKPISRKHVELNLKNDTCYIKDKSSTNGTYINNYRLPIETEMEIKEGQILKIANIEFRFSY